MTPYFLTPALLQANPLHTALSPFPRASARASWFSRALLLCLAAHLSFAPVVLAKKVLILSGGGTKGSYEAGVIQQLDNAVQAGLAEPFEQVYGTSVGAFNAAGYAFKGAQFVSDFWKSVRRRSQVLTPHFVAGILQGGLYTLDPLEAALTHELKDGQKPALLPTVVSTHLNTGLTTFTSYQGLAQPFIDQVIASASVPGLVVPRKIGQQWYVDGGLIDNTPIEQAILDGATDLTVVLCLPLTPIPGDNFTMPQGFQTVKAIPVLLMRSLDILSQKVFLGAILSTVANPVSPITHLPVQLTVYAPRTPLGTTFDFVAADLASEYQRGFEETPLDLTNLRSELTAPSLPVR